MEYIDKIKKKLCKELETISEKSNISDAREMETLWKITDIIKNLGKIKMYEEESGYSEGMHSYDDGMSYARGRRYARRDSMGRYSRDGNSNYSNAYDNNSYGGYSQHDPKEYMLDKIGEMMREADPHQREALKNCMRELEKL